MTTRAIGVQSRKRVTGAEKRIGQRIRARRLERHVTQEGLADHLGITFQQVQKYESGTNRVSASRLQQIANFLQVDINYFIGDMINGKPLQPSPLETFMSTRDGLDIVEAMMKLDPHLRRSVIAMARQLQR
jgi:transcriptional regulator with XRE-family HTH domain